MSVAEALLQGEAVLLPTDTLPGVHVVATAPGAAERLRALKDSPPGRPFLLLVADAEQAFRYGRAADPSDADRLRRVWPGPLTALLAPTEEAPAEWTAEGRSIALRVPDLAPLRDLLTRLKAPLFSTSVNGAGDAPAQNLAEARKCFPSLPWDDLGTEHAGASLSSTVVDLTSHPAQVLRQGEFEWPA